MIRMSPPKFMKEALGYLKKIMKRKKKKKCLKSTKIFPS